MCADAVTIATPTWQSGVEFGQQRGEMPLDDLHKIPNRQKLQRLPVHFGLRGSLCGLPWPLLVLQAFS